MADYSWNWRPYRYGGSAEYIGPAGPPATDERITSRGRGVSPIMVGVVLSIFGWIILNTDLSPPPAGCQPGGRLAGSSACGIHAPIALGVLLVVGGLIIVIAVIAVFLRGRKKQKANVIQL